MRKLFLVCWSVISLICVCLRITRMTLLSLKISHINFKNNFNNNNFPFISILKVIELLPGSGTFIKSFTLKNIQETHIKQTLMARAFMKNIFTKKALAECCLGGKSGQNKKAMSGEKPRRGLYQDAVNAILSK